LHIKWLEYFSSFYPLKTEVIFLEALKSRSQACHVIDFPHFLCGLLNETLSFSSVNIDGSPTEASVQQYSDAERTVFYVSRYHPMLSNVWNQYCEVMGTGESRQQ